VANSLANTSFAAQRPDRRIHRALLGAMDDVSNATSRRTDALALSLPPAVLDMIVERVADRVAQRVRPQAEPWVGVEEVARHLGCKRQRIYDLVCRRQATGIPHRKEGSRLLFRLSEVDRWIKSGDAA